MSLLARVSRPLLVANLIIVGLAIFLGVSLVREISRSRAVPPPRAQQQAAAPAPAPPEPAAVANDALDGYNVIVAKHLFNPSRSEIQAAPTAAAAVPLPPKPVLHGVIIDGAASAAYLEDPSSHRVLVYRVGDSIAGGKLEQIGGDRVLIQRADGPMHVLLSDPAKPKAPAPDPAQPAARGNGRAGGRQLLQPPQQGLPQRPVRTPRSLPPGPQPSSDEQSSSQD